MKKLRLMQLKKASQPELDEHGTWAISYGDMITLLLTFFILFFSIDKNNNKKVKILQASFIEHLHPTGHKEEVPDGVTEDSLPKRFDNILGAEVQTVGEQLIIKFPEISFYDLGQIQVNKEGQKILFMFAQKYLPYASSFDLGIRAFTDNRKVRSGLRFEDNLELSALRAIAAMRILQKSGIPLKNMKIAGYGVSIPEDKPISPKIEKNSIQRQLTEEATSDQDEIFNSDMQAKSRKIVFIIEPATKEKL